MVLSSFDDKDLMASLVLQGSNSDWKEQSDLDSRKSDDGTSFVER